MITHAASGRILKYSTYFTNWITDRQCSPANMLQTPFDRLSSRSWQYLHHIDCSLRWRYIWFVHLSLCRQTYSVGAFSFFHVRTKWHAWYINFVTSVHKVTTTATTYYNYYQASKYVYHTSFIYYVKTVSMKKGAQRDANTAWWL